MMLKRHVDREFPPGRRAGRAEKWHEVAGLRGCFQRLYTGVTDRVSEPRLSLSVVRDRSSYQHRNSQWAMVDRRAGLRAFAVCYVIPATALSRSFRVGTDSGFLSGTIRQVPAAPQLTDPLRVPRAPCPIRLEPSLSFGCVIIHAEVLTRAALPIGGETGMGIMVLSSPLCPRRVKESSEEEAAVSGPVRM
jgi:hypothetical protein